MKTMTIEIPENAPIYVRIAADIASHADEFRRGDRAKMDSAARRELSAAQVEELECCVMESPHPTKSAFEFVCEILKPRK